MFLDIVNKCYWCDINTTNHLWLKDQCKFEIQGTNDVTTNHINDMLETKVKRSENHITHTQSHLSTKVALNISYIPINNQYKFFHHSTTTMAYFKSQTLL